MKFGIKKEKLLINLPVRLTYIKASHVQLLWHAVLQGI